jgi:hypothetical protein
MRRRPSRDYSESLVPVGDVASPASRGTPRDALAEDRQPWRGMIVTHPWFEFEALVIKLFCGATDLLDLGWQDIRGLVQWRAIRVIVMLAKTQTGSSF